MEWFLFPHSTRCCGTILPKEEASPMCSTSDEQKCASIVQWCNSRPQFVHHSMNGMQDYPQLVPLDQKYSCQKRLMNNRSLLETKLWGIPWILTMISMNKEATIWVVWAEGNIPRWIPFKKWSTTTSMVVFPWYDGSPAIRSNERSSQGRYGTGRGHNNPAT